MESFVPIVSFLHVEGHLPLSQYLVALGSNQRHQRHGTPRQVIRAAATQLDDHGQSLLRLSKIISARPLGPSQRNYANAAAIVETALTPPELLHYLKSVEAQFGLRRGQRWSKRVLDLDIILWSEGAHISGSPALIIPHPEFRVRPFVLEPATEIAAAWHDPVSSLSVAQISARLRRFNNPPRKLPKPLDPKPKRH
ncbi:2-amino-4-hydroxy-6-hydroxymethyldihydropteridine diphosphokinase [Parasphingorhabdus sp.]|uniref:2-amino-4-hydroxy-6- hydroxymethyldihydropteridine diphosphokinase n=1 Tax=Parasphingorhabdus sp. TaxID=2709688 RepID=UPI003D27C932